MTVTTKKQISPISVRVTLEQRAQLEKDAVGMSLSDHIRSRLFDETRPKRRTRNKNPVKDYVLIAQVLGELQDSRLKNNMNQIAKQTNRGYPDFTPETDKAIQAGCADIRWMRNALMAALGLMPENNHDS